MTDAQEKIKEKYDLIYRYVGIECEVTFEDKEHHVTTVYGTVAVKTSKHKNVFFINNTEYLIDNLKSIVNLKS